MSADTPVTGPALGANLSGIEASDAITNKPTGTDELRPAAIFSHGMVLQRCQPIALFGTGVPGQPIIATLGTTTAVRPIRIHSQTSANTHYFKDEGFSGSPAPENAIVTNDSISISGTVRQDGTWLVTLPALEAGGPYVLTISNRSDIALQYHDVQIGEVWIASGQSNMEFELRNDAAANETLANCADPLLRFFNTPKFGVVDETLVEAENMSAWQQSSPDNSKTMSAVAYYFARRLRQALGPDVPVGIIDCYIGGTSINAWMSEQMLETTAAGRRYLARYHEQIAGKTTQDFTDETVDWQRRFDAWNANIATARSVDPAIPWDALNARFGECPWPPPITPFSQYRVTGAFGAMIRRISPYTLRGFLWYQGEEDESYASDYHELLDCLISEWREQWGHATDKGTSPTDCGKSLPFIIVQLPRWISKEAFDAGIDSLAWPTIREAQATAAATISGVYLTVTLDTGEFNNIHPTNKQPVGERMAAQALTHVYRCIDVASEGPIFAGVSTRKDTPEQQVSNANHALHIRFLHGNGLHFDHFSDEVHSARVATAGTADSLHSNCSVNNKVFRVAADSGFDIRGVDDTWYPADALIEHDTVTLSCSSVSEPVAARYGWFSWGPTPLYNGDQLPAAPFTM